MLVSKPTTAEAREFKTINNVISLVQREVSQSFRFMEKNVTLLFSGANDGFLPKYVKRHWKMFKAEMALGFRNFELLLGIMTQKGVNRANWSAEMVHIRCLASSSSRVYPSGLLGVARHWQIWNVLLLQMIWHAKCAENLCFLSLLKSEALSQSWFQVN